MWHPAVWASSPPVNLLSADVLPRPAPIKHKHRRRQEVTDVYATPLMDLVYSAASVHRMYNDPTMVSCLETATSSSSSSSRHKQVPV